MRASTFTALVTAFRNDESVDFDKVKDEARRQIAAGNDIFACGTNGDFSSLTFAEKVGVVQACADACEGRSRLIANAGCPSTHETVLLAREFAAAGVEAVAAITPYFIACTQEGLYRHYARVADELPIPVYIYEIPARTGNSIELDTVARLAKHGNVRGIKDSSGKPERLDGISRIVEENKGFEFYAGTDSLILHALRKGAAGCVSGLANVVPAWIRAIADAFSSGSASEADAAQARVNELREALYALGYPPAMVKRALFLMDEAVGNNRLPALVPDEGADAALRAAIAKFGIGRA
jgi:4-hydroxy-tetrahydrodipicolinate synthase